MTPEYIPLAATELDAVNFPEWRDRILAFDSDPAAIESRTYPGYPRWPLLRVKPRAWPSLDHSLARRRSPTAFSTDVPSKRLLSRLLQMAHGINADRARGPVPSAGGLQALELYLVTLENSWLPAGAYHFDRAGNHLSQIVSSANRSEWLNRVPSLATVQGGAMLFVMVGDYARVEAKYGARGMRFLFIEAGCLGQNLSLLASSVGLGALPLGGFFEQEIARHLALLSTDVVLHVMLCGETGKT